MLKSLNISELEKMAEELGQWCGAQVQEVVGSEREFGLKLHQEGKSSYLWVEMNALAPMVFLFERSFPPFRKKPKPLHLFLKSNFTGGRLQAATVSKEAGRVLFLKFTGEADSQLELELRLFPHGQNAIARVGEKSLSWMKVKEMVPSSTPEKTATPRDFQDLQKAWLESKRPNRSKDSKSEIDSQVSRLKKDLKKKVRALEKLEDAMSSDRAETWLEVGLWLQSYGASRYPQEVPEKFLDLVDTSESLSSNIELCFAKSTKAKKKKEGQLERKSLLVIEIQQLKEKIEDPKKIKVPSTREKGVLESVGAKGRTRAFDDGIEAVVGRSAKDNLTILRRARPWFLWMHIKDEPSAHVVIRRGKNQKVSDKTLQQIFDWFVEVSFSKKVGQFAGAGHEVVLAECRYVHPIKGDRIGRVRYQNAQTLGFSYSRK